MTIMSESIKDFDELVQRLKEIKKMGHVKTHRSGNTGIGKTLEDLLGIEENNVPGPNTIRAELKSARKRSSSMLTLFTKSPLPPRTNSLLLREYGYESKRGNNKKELHTTVKATAYNTLKRKRGFKINVRKDKLELVSSDMAVLGYWDKETLRNAFERKLPELLYVKADFRGSGLDEEFWFNEAWLLSGFDFENFMKLVKEGTICVDIRIGQYPNGRPHDHGTGFRVFPDKLDLCFKHRARII